MKYDIYWSKTQNGLYDFEFYEMESEWKPNLKDIIICQLSLHKRLPNSLLEQNPLLYRGGSVCDVIYNITGRQHGSLIWHYTQQSNISDEIKIQKIKDAIVLTLNELKNIEIIDDFTIELQNKINNYLTFSLDVISNNTRFKIENINVKI